MSKIKFLDIAPNLMTEDVDESVKFYKNALGFELECAVTTDGKPSKGDLGLCWAMMSRGCVKIMLQKRDCFTKEYKDLEGKEIGGSLTLFVSMEGVDEYYAEVGGNVDVLTDPHDTHYGMREFAVKDCNGYTIVFAEQTGDCSSCGSSCGSSCCGQ